MEPIIRDRGRATSLGRIDSARGGFSINRTVRILTLLAALSVAAWYLMQSYEGADVIRSLRGTVPDSAGQVDGVQGGNLAADSTREGPAPADANEPEGPLHVGGDVLAPVNIDAPEPRYTEIAKKARIQGIVIAQTIIDEEGKVTDVKVLKGLPMGLNQETIKAVKTWKYEPATLHGKPVSVYYNVTVQFLLQ